MKGTQSLKLDTQARNRRSPHCREREQSSTASNPSENERENETSVSEFKSLKLMDSFRVFHPAAVQYTLFPGAMELSSKYITY
jgi:hypothetical protein